jgi:protoporphyrinogen oxidase
MQRGYTGSRQNVAVIGGGISGLVSAYRLLQQGYGVTVFEADAELGGLGGTFEHEGRQLEKFYHVMLPSDGDLLGLLEELGMSRQVIWRAIAAATTAETLPSRKCAPAIPPH